MKLEYKNLPFELKEAQKDGSEFKGYASVFHCIDDSWWCDIIQPGAFKADLGDFLKDGLVMWQHDWHEPIGKPLSAEEDEKGLFVHAQLCDTTQGRDAKLLIRDGIVKKMSIGFRVLGREWLETEDEVKAYWARWNYKPTAEDTAKSKYGARLLTRCKLYEFSPVSVPANKRADITEVVKRKSAMWGDGPREGLSFEDHSGAVLEAVSEYVERTKGYLRMCSEDKREPSRKRLAEFRRLRDDLGKLIENDSPPVDESTKTLNPDQIYATFLEAEARICGYL